MHVTQDTIIKKNIKPKTENKKMIKVLRHALQGTVSTKKKEFE